MLGYGIPTITTHRPRSSEKLMPSLIFPPTTENSSAPVRAPPSTAHLLMTRKDTRKHERNNLLSIWFWRGMMVTWIQRENSLSTCSTWVDFFGSWKIWGRMLFSVSQNERRAFFFSGSFHKPRLTYLFLASQSCQRAAGLPVRNDPPRVFVRWEEAHDPARDHVTNVGENAPRFIHLSANTKCNSTTLQQGSNKAVCVYFLPCVENLCFGK